MKTPLLAAIGLTLLSPTAFGQDANCKVDRKAFVSGGSSSATMIVTSGSSCQFRFLFGSQNVPDSWELATPPRSGNVEFKDDTAEYRPNAGFVGEDAFTVGVYGKSPTARRSSRNGKFEVSVTVTPKQ